MHKKPDLEFTVLLASLDIELLYQAYGLIYTTFMIVTLFPTVRKKERLSTNAMNAKMDLLSYSKTDKSKKMNVLNSKKI